MVNITKIKKKPAFSYKNETFDNNKIKEPEQQKHINTFDMVMKNNRLQNLILTKSLIVKL
tara:strand:+ start:2131 stop:2310 length:180 start_codon:yes stop_codon:yes gene_type:complete